MSNEISVNGECHCGNISISAIVDKNKVRVCHCTDCQKMSGAPFRAIAIALTPNGFAEKAKLVTLP